MLGSAILFIDFNVLFISHCIPPQIWYSVENKMPEIFRRSTGKYTVGSQKRQQKIVEKACGSSLEGLTSVLFVFPQNFHF